MSRKLGDLHSFAGSADRVPDADHRLMAFLAGDQKAAIRRVGDRRERLFSQIDDVRLLVTLSGRQGDDNPAGQVRDRARNLVYG